MDKHVISFDFGKCKQCLKCIRVCPTQAICKVKGCISIDASKCIYCGACIEVCDKNCLRVENSHMGPTMPQYDYKVALLPTSFFAEFEDSEEAGTMVAKIEALGFDEVVEYSDVDGALYLKTIEHIEQNQQLNISSFCPVVNRYIQINYPMLLDSVVPLDYPVEVAARKIRLKYQNKYQKLGIYSLCDCIGKMTIAKEPFGKADSAIDHAMSLSHIFPKANRMKCDTKKNIRICREGISSIVGDFYHYYQAKRSVMALTGLSQVKQALELSEFGHLDQIGLLGLFACPLGCIGGQYLWSNPLEGRLYIDGFAPEANKPVATIDDVNTLMTLDPLKQESLKNRMKLFHGINEILKQLPQYDCGACGYADCRHLARAVYFKEAKLETCRCKVGEEDDENHDSRTDESN